jgi:predicted transcriptional regulator of viral defense system
LVFGGQIMQKIDALNTLKDLDRRGVYVLTKADLAKAFPDEEEKTLEKSLQRLVSDGILERVTKGIYLNPMATSKKSHVVEDIAAVLRRSHLSYVSMESMLSEYGVISQVPVRRVTIMTTGAKGTYNTPYGTIEFTHTKRRLVEIIRRTAIVKNRPLRIALKAAAVQDLVRAGRNTGMMNMAEIE